MVDEGQQQILAQEPHNRRRDAVADKVKGVGCSRRQSIGVWQPHQSRRLTRGHQSRLCLFASYNNQELAARAAAGRSQTSREAVKARLGLHANAAEAVWAGAAEQGADRTLAALARGRDVAA